MTTTETAQPATPTYSLWEDTQLKESNPVAWRLLLDIAGRADQLRDKIREVRRESEEALERMARGERAAWHTDLYGQAVTDANRLNTELQTMVNVAARLGVDQAKLNSVYRNGEQL